MTASLPVVVTPSLFHGQPQTLDVAAGTSVREVLARAVDGGLLALADLARTSVYVDGARLDRATALDVRLAADQVVNLVHEPAGGGGGGKDIGQVLLSVAVIALAGWVGGPAGAGLGLKSALARSVAQTAVLGLGQAALGALFRPEASGGAANDRYALQSASNSYRPFEAFPLALGEVVVAPDLVAKTFTRVDGDDVWIHGILGAHYGPCAVSDVKIGDTLVSSMGAGDVQMAYHLTPGPRTFSLYPNDVDQLDLTEELEADTTTATPVVRAASGEGERFEFDVFFPAGLHFQKDDGRVISASITLTIRYRPIDEEGEPTGGWTSGLTIPLTSASRDPWRLTRGFSLPLGRYEFEVSRSIKPDDNSKRRDQVMWTAVRAIAYRQPVTDETLSLIEFAVRATALNQGALAPITCRVTPICEVWNGTAWGDPQPTSNPAALMRWLMTGPAPARPLSPSAADQGLRTWSALCDAYGWTAHFWLTGDVSQAQAMALLDQAGRCSTWDDGAALQAAPWVEKPAPVQLFAGENLRDHKWALTYVDPVHALRVEFQNLAAGGEPDEVWVYADGYGETANPAAGIAAATLVEALRLEGQKTPERAWKDGRWELGRRLHQRRVDTWSCDAEVLAARYGSRVRLAWSRVDGASARVRCRRWTGELVSGLRLTQPVTFRPGKVYAVDLRLTGGVSAAVAVTNPATTVEVATREIIFATPRAEAASPRAGDLVAFGLADQVSEDVEIIGIEPGEGLTATLTGVRYVAPLLMAGETGPIPELPQRLTYQRRADPPAPTLLGVVAAVEGVRVDFTMPVWRGSPLTGYAVRWRRKPEAGETVGWTPLPDLGAASASLATPAVRELPGEDEVTALEIEIRAMTATGQVSPPLLAEAMLATVVAPDADDWTVTPRPAGPGGEQQPGLTVDGLVTDPLATSVRISHGPTSTGPWTAAWAGPLAAGGVVAATVEALDAGQTYYLSVETVGADRLASPPLILGPYIAPGLIAGDTTAVGGLPVDDLLDAMVDLGARIDTANAVLDRTRAWLNREAEFLRAQMGQTRVGLLAEYSERVSALAVEIERIDGLIASVGGLDDGLGELTAAIATLESLTVDLENATSLASRLGLIEAALETPTTGLLARLSSVESAVVATASDIDDLTGALDLLAEDVDDLDTALTAAVTDINDLTAVVHDPSTGLPAAQASITTISQAVATQGAAGAYRAQRLAIAAGLAAVSVLAETTVRATETTALYDDLDVVTLIVGGLDDDLGALAVTVGTHTTAIADLDSGKASASSLSALALDVGDNSTDIGLLFSAVSDLDEILEAKITLAVDVNGRVTGIVVDGVEETLELYGANVVIHGDLLVAGTVTTAALVDHSVTAPAQAYTSGSISLNGTTFVVVQHCDIAATGGALDIDVNFHLTIWHPGGGDVSATILVRRTPDYSTYTTLFNQTVPAIGGDNIMGWQTILLRDEPDAGTWRYEVVVYLSTSTGLSTQQAFSRMIRIREYKK